MVDRVVVFVDYQNAYMGAREVLGSLGKRTHSGSSGPLRLVI